MKYAISILLALLIGAVLMNLFWFGYGYNITVWEYVAVFALLVGPSCIGFAARRMGKEGEGHGSYELARLVLIGEIGALLYVVLVHYSWLAWAFVNRA